MKGWDASRLDSVVIEDANRIQRKHWTTLTQRSLHDRNSFLATGYIAPRSVGGVYMETLQYSKEDFIRWKFIR
jgi:hypothetical protein